VLFGTAALLLGLGALVSAKGGFRHRRFGRWFLYAISVVLVSATVGLLVFNFRAFLAVVTLLSSYEAFSGFRALRLRGARPARIDQAASAVGIVSPILLLMAMSRLQLPWDPVLTYSILGALFMVTTYDISRNFLPTTWLRRVWVQEHLVKMIGAFSAVSSAFAGTVFPGFMPWSGILPSAMGSLLIVMFLWRLPTWIPVSASAGSGCRPSGTGLPPTESWRRRAS
jgi:hypothetical protein